MVMYPDSYAISLQEENRISKYFILYKKYCVQYFAGNLKKESLYNI